MSYDVTEYSAGASEIRIYLVRVSALRKKYSNLPLGVSF